MMDARCPSCGYSIITNSTICTKCGWVKKKEVTLTPEDIIDTLQSEIVWCLDNPDKDLNHDQQMGFMNGLRQAQTLITRMVRALETLEEKQP